MWPPFKISIIETLLWVDCRTISPTSYPKKVTSKFCADRNLADRRMKCWGANPQLEWMDSCAVLGCADPNQPMLRPFETPPLFPVSPAGSWPALLWHPINLSISKEQWPYQLVYCLWLPQANPQLFLIKKLKEETLLIATRKPNGHFSTLLCIFECWFAYLPASANYKVINLSVNFIHIITWFLSLLTCKGMRSTQFKRWNIHHGKCYYWDTLSKTTIHSFSTAEKSYWSQRLAGLWSTETIFKLHLFTTLLILLTVNKMK